VDFLLCIHPGEAESLIEIAGDLDLFSTTQPLYDRLTAVTSPVLVVDLSGVTFASVTGARTLVRLSAHAEACGQDLMLVNPSAAVRAVLELTGWQQTLPLLSGQPATIAAPPH
jgi:anti-sigma B factor antagonist